MKQYCCVLSIKGDSVIDLNSFNLPMILLSNIEQNLLKGQKKHSKMQFKLLLSALIAATAVDAALNEPCIGASGQAGLSPRVLSTHFLVGWSVC
jgi:hypothetical protein